MTIKANAKGGYLTLQASTDEGVGSAVIRYLEGPDAKVSHIDIVLPTPNHTPFAVLISGWLLGARSDGGVQVRPPNYAKFTYVRRMRVWVPDERAAYSFLAAQIGKPYNRAAILDFFLHRDRCFTMDQASWFCDELFYAFALAGGTQMLHDANPCGLSPECLILSDKLEDV